MIYFFNLIQYFFYFVVISTSYKFISDLFDNYRDVYSNFESHVRMDAMCADGTLGESYNDACTLAKKIVQTPKIKLILDKSWENFYSCGTVSCFELFTQVIGSNRDFIAILLFAIFLIIFIAYYIYSRFIFKPQTYNSNQGGIPIFILPQQMTYPSQPQLKYNKYD